jgi:hypothetical protein
LGCLAVLSLTQHSSGSFKPIWHLKPLPLQPNRSFRPHPKSSLHSLCLTKISHDFHLYTPELLASLPPTIIERILHRVRADRGYEASYDDVQRNPDVTTIWAFSALLDPDGEGTQADHLIGLPLDNTLQHLKPDENANEVDEHPLIHLPELWNRLNPTSSYSLLTTLTLDGVNNMVNDTNLLHLRYCTHLTLLWTRGCKITDLGVRLLASALDLPERKGLCRLRGWFMPGCTGVSDRSIRSLARWPGLCALDTRGTSVTDAGMAIFNRYSRVYFGGENADMQAVTPGLLGLFADGAGGTEVLEALCLTLLAGDRPAREKTVGTSEAKAEDSSRWWLALHVKPTSHPLDPAWVPYSSSGPARSTSNTAGGVYRPGIGMVYGQGAGSMGDEVSTFRDSLKVALRIQAEKEGLADRDLTIYRWDTANETWKQYRKRLEKHERGIASRDIKAAKAEARADLAAAKEEAERERSKAFVGGARGTGKLSRGRAASEKRDGRGEEAQARGTVKDQRELMLVRMVAPNWEDLRWVNATTAADGTASTSQIRTTHTTTKVDLVADIMGTQRTRVPIYRSSPPGQASTSPVSAQSGRKRPPSPTRDRFSAEVKPEPTSTPSRPFSNPFKRNASSTQHEVRPLSQARVSPPQTPRSASSVVKSATATGGVGRKLEEDFNFGVGTKRRFEGKAEGDGSRRGMKMFSGKRT